MTTSAPGDRPRIVDVAFWCVIAGAVVLIVGGLMASTATYEAARAAIPDSVSDDDVRTYLTVYRTTGIGAVLIGGALAFLAGRARRGDDRFRRALLGLTLACVLVVLLLAIGVKVAQPLILMALLPLMVGGALLLRPAASHWYDREGQR
ncbi:hypothetical protein CRI77_01765 [Mycolicibacterium duvalii]|nr:hypothetical protein [Mycolicibacterium duvalii]MCV7367548.1 hypothetical protein [Mycolicibacterium duvalii]PEG44129.1 hypothetical protein CRI77_01765 [Mycolicibacterium duvalii]